MDPRSGLGSELAPDTDHQIDRRPARLQVLRQSNAQFPAAGSRQNPAEIQGEVPPVQRWHGRVVVVRAVEEEISVKRLPTPESPAKSGAARQEELALPPASDPCDGVYPAGEAALEHQPGDSGSRTVLRRLGRHLSPAVAGRPGVGRAGSARRRSAPADAVRTPRPTRRSPRNSPAAHAAAAPGRSGPPHRESRSWAGAPARESRSRTGRGTTRETRRTCRHTRPAAPPRPARTSSGSSRGTRPRESATARSPARRTPRQHVVLDGAGVLQTDIGPQRPGRGARNGSNDEPAPRGGDRIDRTIRRKALRRQRLREQSSSSSRATKRHARKITALDKAALAVP